MTESNSQQALIVVESGGLAFGAGVSRNLTVNCFGSGENSATCEFVGLWARAGVTVRARARARAGVWLGLGVGLGLELRLGLGLGLGVPWG